MYSSKWKIFGAPIALALIASLSIGLIFWNNDIGALDSTIQPVAFEDREGGDGERKEITLIAQDADIEIAPGKVVKTWTFNGTVPAPTLRFTEGDNISIKFINKTPIPHTIHFHGNHDDLNDGVEPQIMPNETYIYNITAAPAGLLMYHCHAYPTSLHIRMGMYGALLVDPKDNPLPPAREFMMVMGEYDSKNIMNFEAEYYPINGYADQYVSHPIEANYDELVRFYVINIGTTIPYQFHLHSTTFMAYPSGLVSNTPIHAQTIPVGPGDATIIDAKWEYPGTYLFHSHGFQEERGNMGMIVLSDSEGDDVVTPAVESESISMFDWQYNLQKELQKPRIIEYDDAELDAMAESSEASGHAGHAPVPDNPSGIPTQVDPTTNSTGTPIPADQSSAEKSNTISILAGSSNPSSEVYYDPPTGQVTAGDVTWVNNDTLPHTATAGDSESGPSGAFDTGIIAPAGQATVAVDAGTYDYYCTLHPYMTGSINVQ